MLIILIWNLPYPLYIYLKMLCSSGYYKGPLKGDLIEFLQIFEMTNEFTHFERIWLDHRLNSGRLRWSVRSLGGSRQGRSWSLRGSARRQKVFWLIVSGIDVRVVVVVRLRSSSLGLKLWISLIPCVHDHYRWSVGVSLRRRYTSTGSWSDIRRIWMGADLWDFRLKRSYLETVNLAWRSNSRQWWQVIWEIVEKFYVYICLTWIGVVAR